MNEAAHERFERLLGEGHWIIVQRPGSDKAETFVERELVSAAAADMVRDAEAAWESLAAGSELLLRLQKCDEVDRLREALVVAEAKLEEWELWGQEAGGALGVKRLRELLQRVLEEQQHIEIGANVTTVLMPGLVCDIRAALSQPDA